MREADTIESVRRNTFALSAHIILSCLLYII